MKFALLGDHPDGLDVTRALTATGRHELQAYAGPGAGLEVLNRAGLTPRRVGDIEEILADPGIEGVVVASGVNARGPMLRRAVQSERHVLCVHPADSKPDLAFEIALMRADAGCVVLPLLPEAFHPAFARFGHLARQANATVLECRRASREEFWLDLEGDAPRPGLPGWDVLRRIGGEIVEIFGQSSEEEPTRGRPLLLVGKFADGRLFHAVYQSNQPENFWRIAAVGSRPLALVFPDGWPGAASLTYEDETGALRTESWPPLPPWSPLIDAFERALATRRFQKSSPGKTDDTSWTTTASPNAEAIQAADTMVGVSRVASAAGLGWTDEIRGLELDDAVRRSLHYRRAMTLDLQEATEESSFKGTMTLVGCSLMWLILVLLFLSIWFPWLGWVIFPSLAIFLVLQVLRRFVKDDSPSKSRRPGADR